MVMFRSQLNVGFVLGVLGSGNFKVCLMLGSGYV